jgi:hydroxyacylglutathione hydrolase
VRENSTLVVDRFELGPIGTNCYVVRADLRAPEAVVVDPGSDAAELILKLAELETSVAAILITHGHWDHLGGVADLAEGTGAPVYMAEDERALLENLPELVPEGVSARSYTPDVLLRGDETLELARIGFETLRVPGHSPAHLAYNADLPGADWETLVESIRMLSERFPPETMVYPGHGPPTTLGAELERNPFLTQLRAS